MKNILLISGVYNYIILSIKRQLEELSYHIIMPKADTNEIYKITAEISAILVYVDEELAKSRQTLIFIKDKAIEDDTPVFIIGDKAEIEAAKESIPEHLIQQQFLRPVNVKKVADAADGCIKAYAEHRRGTILVVDDSGAVLRNVKGWLEDRYKVILANSGAMAIKYLALNRPDLVLLDYEMPVCDGKQVLEMIRTETEFADIPVIFLTGKADRKSVMDVMSLKPEGYLLKNMEPAQIVRAVDDFFEKRKVNKS